LERGDLPPLHVDDMSARRREEETRPAIAAARDVATGSTLLGEAGVVVV